MFNETVKFSEDEEYATRMIMKKERFGYVHDVLYVYRKHEMSANGTYSVSQTVFDKFLIHYRTILTAYTFCEYLQNVFLNTLRWRLTENKLWPAVEKSKHLENIESGKELLQYVDVNTILKYKDMNIFHKTYLCKLKNCVTSSKLANGEFQFYVNNKMVYKHRDVNCHVYDIQYTDGILKFKGELLSFCFATFKPQLQICCESVKTNIDVNDLAFNAEISYMLGNEVQLFVEYNKVRYHVNPYFTMKFDEYLMMVRLFVVNGKMAL